MTAILFGSISTIADTSELQRAAFNQAFAAHDLDWEWRREDYYSMLESTGGAQRIADYARERGEDVDAEAIHATKSRIFQEGLAESRIAPRDGVVETIRDARSNGLKVALVTTTSRANIDALAGALDGQLSLADLDLVVDASQVGAPKPDAAAYTFALGRLGEQARDCVAVEDNVGGVASAQAAGLAVVAFPNQNTARHDFEEADGRRAHLSFDDLRSLIPAR